MKAGGETSGLQAVIESAVSRPPPDSDAGLLAEGFATYSMLLGIHVVAPDDTVPAFAGVTRSIEPAPRIA